MIRLSQGLYEMALAALSAPLRKRLEKAVTENGGFLQFDDEIGGDVYDELMAYVSLHGFDREYSMTPQGRALEVIADAIYSQFGG